MNAPDPHALDAPPPAYESTRDTLHQLAETVIAPARQAVDGRIRMQSLPGGFGTPRFGDGQQLRVEGTELIVEGPDGVERRPIEGVDAGASRWLGAFYAFMLAVLEDLRSHVTAEDPVLWPEHFDYAIVAGDEASGARASYGGSPGDEHHPEPYLYVAPWQAQEGELWNATGFSGAELPLADLLAAQDQRALALEFYLERVRDLER